MFDDRIDKAIDRLFQFLILDSQAHTKFSGIFWVGFRYYLHQYDMDQHILNTKQVDHYRRQNKKCILVLDKYLQVLLLIHQNQLVWALLVYESLSVEGALHYKRRSEGKYVAHHLDSTFLAAKIRKWQICYVTCIMY